MKQKAMKRTSVFAALVLAAVCVLSGFALLFGTHRVANADEAAGTAARNANLVVKYDMGNIEGGKIKASKWENGKYVPYTALDATITGGTVDKSEGQEGEGAATFGGGAYAVADSAFPFESGVEGYTFTAWVKNLTADWGDLIEFWGGSDGGRFGKSTIWGNHGNRGEQDWNHRMDPGSGAIFDHNGAWNSFVTVTGGGDEMAMDTWYFVAFTLTQNSLLHYRNDE